MPEHDLASAIFFRLPRELRNHIYTYCIESFYGNEVIVRRSRKPKAGFVLLTRKHYGPHAYQWVDDPICSLISTDKLREEVGREMLEIYYWTRTFRFSHHELPSVVSFLHRDHLGLGIAPVAYVRCLHLQVHHGMSTGSPTVDWTPSRQQACVQAIAALGTMLTKRTEIIIDLEGAKKFAEVEGALWMHDTPSAPTILSHIRQLQNKGFRVELRNVRNS